MLGNPLTVDFFEVAQLGAGDLVQLLARDVVVNLRRTFAAGTVGAAQVPGVVLALSDGSFLGAVALGAVIAPLRTVVLAERLAVAIARRPVTKRLTITGILAERLTLTAIRTKGPTLTITSRTITPVIAERLTITVTRRTVIPGFPLPALTAERLTLITSDKRLTLTAIRVIGPTLTITSGKRLTLTITSRTIIP
ncbi:hypothetical protein ACQ7FX_05145 [Arthrobacter koreensis]|uniref:hypothetical protein n=1 Tax=Arthrobacter koreensis TaxID=199136 RepID=UPI003D8C4EDD